MTGLWRLYFLFEGLLSTDLSNSVENSQCYEVFEAKTVEVIDKDFYLFIYILFFLKTRKRFFTSIFEK